MSLHANKSQHFPEALAPGDRSMNYAPLAEVKGSKGQQKFYAADLKRAIRIGIGLHIAPDRAARMLVPIEDKFPARAMHH